MPDQIYLKEAIGDLLKEQGILLKDILDMMDEGRDSTMESLSRVSGLSEEQLSSVSEKLSHRQVNLLTFALYALYLNNMSGLYKGLVLVPNRDEVMIGQRVTLDGLVLVAQALGMDIGES
ncbi:MAG TPA: hypothetical protein VEG31_01985 [Thermoproteota archaeon]|nr:hypothetical protein [Thermoproteota archaeon]